MARTGSGKSLAFLIPLIQRLGGRHSLTFGARALILLPTRELALQILKVGKELARGWRDGEGGHAGDKNGDDPESGKRGQGLRWGLIVGGEGLDDQFQMISSNPDVHVAPSCVRAFDLTSFVLSGSSPPLVDSSTSRWK